MKALNFDVTESDHPRSLPVLRPRTRGDCGNVPRPCPYASCRHNLLVEVGGNGAITFNDAARSNFTRIASDADFDAATDAALDEWIDGETLRPSCALDVVDANIGDEMPLDAVGKLLGVTRERVRQIEQAARAKLTAPLAALTGKRPRD